MSDHPRTVLAVDPGRSKCGVAVVTCGLQVLYQGVVPAQDLQALARDLVAAHSPDVIIIGSGTSASQARESISLLGCAVEMVDERFSSLAARKRYFQRHPPRGIRRLIPTSLQTPGRPYDDYVAIILAENYLRSARGT